MKKFPPTVFQTRIYLRLYNLTLSSICAIYASCSTASRGCRTTITIRSNSLITRTIFTGTCISYTSNSYISFTTRSYRANTTFNTSDRTQINVVKNSKYRTCIFKQNEILLSFMVKYIVLPNEHPYLKNSGSRSEGNGKVSYLPKHTKCDIFGHTFGYTI